jgi:hypothetical protein
VLERLAVSLPVRGDGGRHLRVGGRGDRVGDLGNDGGGGGDENTV